MIPHRSLSSWQHQSWWPLFVSHHQLHRIVWDKTFVCTLLLSSWAFIWKWSEFFPIHRFCNFWLCCLLKQLKKLAFSIGGVFILKKCIDFAAEGRHRYVPLPHGIVTFWRIFKTSHLKTQLLRTRASDTRNNDLNFSHSPQLWQEDFRLAFLSEKFTSKKSRMSLAFVNFWVNFWVNF